MQYWDLSSWISDMTAPVSSSCEHHCVNGSHFGCRRASHGATTMWKTTLGKDGASAKAACACRGPRPSDDQMQKPKGRLKVYMLVPDDTATLNILNKFSLVFILENLLSTWRKYGSYNLQRPTTPLAYRSRISVGRELMWGS